MSMKKRIATLLVLLLAVTLTACGSLEDMVKGAVQEAITGSEASDEPADEPEDRTERADEPQGEAEIQTSDATDKWPAGVYDAIGFPAYEAGKIAFSYPGDESGGVYIADTTREDILAFLEQLRAAGFRWSDSDQERAAESSWNDVEIFFPEPGNRYSVNLQYSFENDGAGTSAYVYLDENASEETEIFYNVYFYIENHGDPSNWSWNQTGLLEAYGIPDEAIMIDNADQIVEEVNNDDMAMMGGITIEFVHDFELTAEVWRPWAIRLLEACVAASDNGQVLDTWTQEPLDIEAAKSGDNTLSSFLYPDQGKTYMMQLFSESGYGESITVMFQQVQ
jgi:hypothetical protein